MKSILVILPYLQIYPPINGGMQRCFHILHQLAKYFEVTAIIFQDKESFLVSTISYPAINNVKIYSTHNQQATKDLFSLLPKKIEKSIRYRWIKKSLSVSADGNFLKYYSVLRKLLSENIYDAVILENLASINAVDTIRKYGGKAKILYDAHNVDSKLGVTYVEKFGMKKEYLKGIQKAEENMHATVDAIFACSKEDRNDFLIMNQKPISIEIIPNGVNVEDIYNDGVMEDEPTSILFCGSLNSDPNSEGLLWFYNNCWKKVKEKFPLLKLLVVGSGEMPISLLEMNKDNSIIFSGMVDDVRPWYNKASIVIVPLLSGSGTRLKILEAMSLGVPVVSTTIGAEGIEYTDKNNIEIYDSPEHFSNGIIEMLGDKTKRLKIKENARRLVEEKYDWDIIGFKLKEFLEVTI